MKTKQIFKISALIVVFTLSYFNINVISNNLHDSNLTLFSIVRSAYAADEGGGGFCDKIVLDWYSEYGGCTFHDHNEYCQGITNDICLCEKWQLRMCPPGSWERICEESLGYYCSDGPYR